jgi:alkanesulfonate monooxygenase
MEENAMHVEFTSLINRWTSPQTQKSPVSLASVLDAQKRARLLERHNFDRALICDPYGLPDNDQLGSFLLHNTTSLLVAIPHRAGLVDPTVAAQRFATLDQLCAGRLAIRMVKAPAAGLPGHEPALEHEAELARTDEYLVLLKRLWSNNAPFDHEGPSYSIKNGFAPSKPFATSGVPLILGGASGTAIKVAARHADIFALPAASAGETSRTISRVTAAARTFGRANRIRFSLDIRPVVAGSQDEAATLARHHGAEGANEFVGTPEQVAVTLLRYCDLGVSDFVVHGLETPGAIADFGDSVIPLVRRSIERASVDAEAFGASRLSNWRGSTVRPDISRR